MNTPSDALVFDSLVAQPHLQDSSVSVCNRSLSMQPKQTFEFLSSWVLPSEQHWGFRVTADFASGNFSWANSGSESKHTKIVSPAMLALLAIANDDQVQSAKPKSICESLRDLLR